MYAAAGEPVSSHLQGSDLFKDSHQHRYLQQLEEEFISTLHSNALTRGVKESNYEDHHLSFLGGPSGRDLLPSSSISDYDIEEGEFLFEAPDSVIEEHLLPLHTVTESISMISDVEDIISGQTMISVETDSLGTNTLLNEIYSELTEDLLVKPTNEKPVSELPDVKFPTLQQEDVMQKDVQRDEKEYRLLKEAPLQKSVSSGCLTPNDRVNGWSASLDLVRLQGIDPGVVFRMRRAYSEGDIKNLSNRVPQAPAMVLPLLTPCLITVESVKSEERMQKLVRYRMKKFKRNFGRKIKYACRKALADIQPRVRGRFARTDECDTLKHLN